MQKYTILHLNIETNKHLEKVSAVLSEHKPDFVCFEEALKKDVEQLAEKHSYHHAYSPRFYWDQEQYSDEEGSAILSKIPISNIKKDRYDDHLLDEIPYFGKDGIKKEQGKRPQAAFSFFHSLLSAEVPVREKLSRSQQLTSLLQTTVRHTWKSTPLKTPTTSFISNIYDHILIRFFQKLKLSSPLLFLLQT